MLILLLLLLLRSAFAHYEVIRTKDINAYNTIAKKKTCTLTACILTCQDDLICNLVAFGSEDGQCFLLNEKKRNEKKNKYTKNDMVLVKKIDDSITMESEIDWKIPNNPGSVLGPARRLALVPASAPASDSGPGPSPGPGHGHGPSFESGPGPGPGPGPGSGPGALPGPAPGHGLGSDLRPGPGPDPGPGPGTFPDPGTCLGPGLGLCPGHSTGPGFGLAFIPEPAPIPIPAPSPVLTSASTLSPTPIHIPSHSPSPAPALVPAVRPSTSPASAPVPSLAHVLVPAPSSASPSAPTPSLGPVPASDPTPTPVHAPMSALTPEPGSVPTSTSIPGSIAPTPNRVPNSRLKFIPSPAPAPGSYRGCTFMHGDGRGTTEVKIGRQTGNACIDACIQMKQTDASINGVTIFANNRGGCWCEKEMSGRTKNYKYKTCFIKNVPYRGCTGGDGRGTAEVKIGQQTGNACIDACIQMKQTDASINGVTIFFNNRGGCWCEKEMTGRITNYKYKTCFIKNVPYRGCTFMGGDGRGTAEVKIGQQTGNACIDACIQMKQTDASINGVTIFSNNRGGCWCEKEMTGRITNYKYKTCFIKDV